MKSGRLIGLLHKAKKEVEVVNYAATHEIDKASQLGCVPQTKVK